MYFGFFLHVPHFPSISDFLGCPFIFKNKVKELIGKSGCLGGWWEGKLALTLEAPNARRNKASPWGNSPPTLSQPVYSIL